MTEGAAALAWALAFAAATLLATLRTKYGEWLAGAGLQPNVCGMASSLVSADGMHL